MGKRKAAVAELEAKASKKPAAAEEQEDAGPSGRDATFRNKEKVLILASRGITHRCVTAGLGGLTHVFSARASITRCLQWRHLGTDERVRTLSQKRKAAAAAPQRRIAWVGGGLRGARTTDVNLGACR